MICTFYSYKGGVGRSMAMANVADVLSRRGSKILMIDFDLEAPGLEQFFDVNHDGVRRHAGLLDLLLSYKQAMSVARTDDAAFRRLESFICPVYERLPGGGRLDIMPAGQRQDPDQLARYALNLRTFDWQEFYFNWEGGLFFEWLRRSLVPRPYDLVLVDSRTGVTEMGGICGYQLADAIVMLCAANHQNIHGTDNMLRDFRSSAVEAHRRGRRLDIVVVPARIEQRDPALLEDFFARFEQKFGGLLPDPLRRGGLDFRQLTIPYEPRFAFEERIVSDPARAAEREGIADAFGQLARAVALLAMPAAALEAPVASAETAGSEAGSAASPAPAPRPPSTAAPSRSEAARPAPIQYDATKRFAGYDFFLDSSRPDRDAADALAQGLRARALRVFLDREDVAAGEDWQGVVEEALFHSRVLLFCIGGSGLSELRRRTLALALQARERRPQFSIVPVLLPGSDPGMLLGTPLVERAPLDLRAGFDAAAFDRLEAAALQPRTAATPAEAEARDPFAGARPFLESDADLFFGREAVVQPLLGLLLENAVVTVTGPSGCGKSSLVLAGLVPALRRASSERRWTVIQVRPGAEALLGFAGALLEDAVDPTAAAGSPEPAARGLGGLLQAAAQRAAPGGLLLFLDQLEDLFLTTRPESRAEFVDALAGALAERPANVRVVLAIRSSFLEGLRQLPQLWPQLEKGVFEVPLLTPDDLRQAIEEPVERVGAAFEPGLVDRIVGDMRGEPGALPLLQALLFRLWRDRREGWLTNDAYSRVGGLSGVLAAQAEDSFGALPPREQAALQWMIVRLVRIGRSRKEDSCRRRAFEELLPAGVTLESEPGQPYVAAGKALVDAGLLTSSNEDGRRMLEPAHDSLIRVWKRLGAWLDEDRAFLLWRDQLGMQALDWRGKGGHPELLLRGVSLVEAETWLSERGTDLNDDERALIEASLESRKAAHLQQDRKRRISMVALGTAATVFLGLALGAFSAMRSAQRQQRRADDAQRRAEEQSSRAVAQESLARNAQEQVQFQQKALGGLLASLKPSVVAVLSGSQVVGTGFFVSSRGLLVTAGHVAKAAAGRLQVKESSGRILDAELLRVDEKRDVALLRARSADPTAPLVLSEEPVRSGSPVVALGMGQSADHSELVEWMPVSGSVLKEGSREEELDGPLDRRSDLIAARLGTVAGFSGAPVVDLKLAVVAVAAYFDAGGASHNDLLIPAARIRAAFGKELAAER